MFEVGFSELLLCFLVALVVLGPEKLPRVAAALGRWAGQARGYLRRLSTELERETQLAQMKQQLEDTQRQLREQVAQAQAAVKKDVAGDVPK